MDYDKKMQLAASVIENVFRKAKILETFKEADTVIN